MAYFGGSVSARPWPKIDIRFVVIFLCSFFGLSGCIFLARDLPFFQEAGAASSFSAPTRSVEPVMIPVAIPMTEIPAGTWLTSGMFRFELRTVVGLEGQVVQNLDEISGTYARAVLSRGVPLLKAALAKGASTTAITDRIPAGHRAVAIPINALTGVEGWVQPGATVDVVWSVEQDRQLLVSTIVENARVLSVERSLEPSGKLEARSPSQPEHITLLVPTRDAQKIQLAKGAGSLNLSLRGAGDAQQAGDSTLTMKGVLARANSRPLILGRVKVDGVAYELRGGELVPAESKESAEAR
jgi:pilus assembly protein CpaB